MATRCGDIDPGLLPFLAAQGYSVADIDKLMNKQSGLLGLCGAADMRAVSKQAANGNVTSKLAIEVRPDLSMQSSSVHMKSYSLHSQYDRILRCSNPFWTGSFSPKILCRCQNDCCCYIV
jgi:acetate kinase